MKIRNLIFILPFLCCISCSFNKKIKADGDLTAKERLPTVESFVEQTAKAYSEGKLDKKIVTTASGLKYIIHQKGTGATVKSGETIVAHYYGCLTDGTVFDNSFKRNEPFVCPIGMRRVIKGWEEGFLLFNEGTKATLFIPADLAYGDKGAGPIIKAGDELVYYIELEEIKK